MNLNLEGKSVVITGGATGIGRAAAMEFAREGAVVSVCARRLSTLEQMREDAGKEGLQIDIYRLDVTDAAAMESMAEDIAKKRGGIDVWLNNAGVAINRPVMEFTSDEYRYMMGINLDAVFFGCRIAAKHMIAQGRDGVILNASSYAAKIPHAEGAVYAATKAAVSSLTKTFAANLAPYGIRVVGYIPGMIVTEISTESIAANRRHYTQNIALQRLGVPEDLAKPLVFLASDAAGYISGVDIEIAGGKYAVQNSEYPWLRAGGLSVDSLEGSVGPIRSDNG